MRTKILFIVFIATISFRGYSQDTLVPTYSFNDINRNNYIMFSPLTLLELEPSMMIGYEYPFGKIKIQHEIGYVGLFNPTYGMFNWDIDFSKITSKGFKVRTSFKFPMKSMYPNRPIKYVGIDIMYKYLNFTQKDHSIWLQQSYWQLMDFTTEKQVIAIHLVYGIRGFISQLNNITSDSYFGIGLRYKMIKNDAPEGYSPSYPWYDEYTGPMISIMGGFKFGFGI